MCIRDRYKGLAAFEAEAELNASLRVKPNRLAAWTVAVDAAERAVLLNRQNRIKLLTQPYVPVPPRKIALGPKKQKRPYMAAKNATSSSKDKTLTDGAALNQDGASPPRKKLRRRSSVSVNVNEGSVGQSDSRAMTVTAECEESLVTVSSQSEPTTAESSTAGKHSIYVLFWLIRCLLFCFCSKLINPENIFSHLYVVIVETSDT